MWLKFCVDLNKISEVIRLLVMIVFFVSPCMYMSMYEYQYFDYVVFHVHIEKEKEIHTKKERIIT